MEFIRGLLGGFPPISTGITAATMKEEAVGDRDGARNLGRGCVSGTKCYGRLDLDGFGLQREFGRGFPER